MNNSYTSFVCLVTFVLLYSSANQNNCIQPSEQCEVVNWVAARYSGGHKSESSPVFVRHVEILLYIQDFQVLKHAHQVLKNVHQMLRHAHYALQLLRTFFALNLLPCFVILAILVYCCLKDLNRVRGKMVTLSNQVFLRIDVTNLVAK